MITVTPMADFEPQTVRNGKQVMRFIGKKIVHTSSAREWSPRWSEIIIYALPGGGYVCSKLGASLVAHRPDCRRVNSHMKPWIDAGDAVESAQHRVPCRECQPVVGADMDPQTRIEMTIHTAYVADGPSQLFSILVGPTQESAEPSPLIAGTLDALVAADRPFRDAGYWSTEPAFTT